MCGETRLSLAFKSVISSSEGLDYRNRQLHSVDPGIPRQEPVYGCKRRSCQGLEAPQKTDTAVELRSAVGLLGFKMDSQECPQSPLLNPVKLMLLSGFGTWW